MAFTQQVQLSPSARDWTQLRTPRKCADERVGTGTTRHPVAIQYVNRVQGDGYAAVLDPEHGEPRRICDDEIGEIWRGLTDESLTDLAPGREKRRRPLHQVWTRGHSERAVVAATSRRIIRPRSRALRCVARPKVSVSPGWGALRSPFRSITYRRECGDYRPANLREGSRRYRETNGHRVPTILTFGF